MSDVWVRIAVLLILAAAALTFAWSLRRRGFPRSIPATGLGPGVYFFSSATCDTCRDARLKLDAALGRNGYIEVPWQDDRRHFDRLGIEAVPAVLLVDDQGRGRLYPGQPERALSEV